MNASIAGIWPVNYEGSWEGATVVCMASGPSMTQADAEACRGRARVIVVNTTFRLAPWADICYTNDDDWLKLHLGEMRESFEGQIWCGHPTYRSIWVHSLPFDKLAPGCAGPGRIAWGMNSGAAAIDLARYLGAARIVLLGYDQDWLGTRPRWHGRHPELLQNGRPGFRRWAGWFGQAAKDLQGLGIEVVNASRRTSLTCFKRADLSEALA